MSWINIRGEVMMFTRMPDTYPLPSIAHRSRHQFLDQPSIHLVIRGIDDGLEKVIRLFNLVPVEEVGLAELKGLDVVLLLDGDAKDVAGGEDPAAAGAALVGDGGALVGDGGVEGVGVAEGHGGFDEDGVGVGGAEGGEGEAVFGVAEEFLDVLFGGGARDVFAGGGEDVG